MRGIGVSPGIAYGRVFKRSKHHVILEKNHIDDPAMERMRLLHAREQSKLEVAQLRDKARDSIGEEEAQIFEAHLALLDDPEFFEAIQQKIDNERVTAEWAVSEVTQDLVRAFENMENEYFRARSADIKDISSRMTALMQGREAMGYSCISEPCIIVEHDLTPSDTVQMDKELVLGFITEVGGATSHSAIMARSLEIPALAGVVGIVDAVENGDVVLFDGNEGCLYINPDVKLVEEFMLAKACYEEDKNRMQSMIGLETRSSDGEKAELGANIGSPDDLLNVQRNDAEGIGLFRTEFLYMGRDDVPSEEEQYIAYSDVARQMNGKPVVIRTLDIGGDKEVSYMNLPCEMNPFLGYRAIRICLDCVSLFKTQLRALLRASACGNIKIMFPMISSVEELRQAKAILEEAKDELRGERVPFNEEIEVGIMIEIPAAAILSDKLALEVDFFSIGTNDLTQYTTAVDRMNSQISSLYTPYHPALLRLIKMVIENGCKAGIWVGMCGEAAGDAKLIPILLGMGLNEFSMCPGSILKSRSIIRSLSASDMRQHAETVVNLATASEVRQYLDDLSSNLSSSW